MPILSRRDRGSAGGDSFGVDRSGRRISPPVRSTTRRTRPDPSTGDERGILSAEELAERNGVGGGSFGPDVAATEGDIMSQFMQRSQEMLDPYHQKALDTARDWRGEIVGVQQGKAEALRGSQGYTGLQDYAQEMEDLYRAGGLTDVTRANLEKARRAEDQWYRAQEEAQLQDLAERGMAGGGAEVAAGIGARAAAADRMSQNDLDTLSFAQQQALSMFENAANANRDLYSIDEGLAGDIAGAATKGADETYSLSQTLNDQYISLGLGQLKKLQDVTGQVYESAAADVLPAASEGAATVRDEISDTKDTGANVIGRDVGQLGDQGNTLLGQAGTSIGGSGSTPGYTPGPDVAGATEDAVRGVIGDTASTVTGLYDAFADPDKEKER